MGFYRVENIFQPHIVLVSKEDLESIKEGHKRYFQNEENEILVKW